MPDPIIFHPYFTLNASAFVATGPWEVDFNVDNLTDKLYFTPDADTYANLGALPSVGREWRLTLKRHILAVAAGRDRGFRHSSAAAIARVAKPSGSQSMRDLVKPQRGTRLAAENAVYRVRIETESFQILLEPQTLDARKRRLIARPGRDDRPSAARPVAKQADGERIARRVVVFEDDLEIVEHEKGGSPRARRQIDRAPLRPAAQARCRPPRSRRARSIARPARSHRDRRLRRERIRGQQ